MLGAMLIFVTMMTPTVRYLDGMTSVASMNNAPETTFGSENIIVQIAQSYPIAATIREFLAFPKSIWAVIGGPMRGDIIAAFGLNEIRIPTIVPLLVCLPLVALFIYGWRWHPMRKILAVLVIAITLVLSTITHKILMPPAYAIQPRHLVPLALVVLAFSLLGPRALELPKKVSAMVGLSIMFAGTVALVFTQARYTDSVWLWSSTPEHWWWSTSMPGPAWNVVLTLTGLGVMALGGALLSPPPVASAQNDLSDVLFHNEIVRTY